MSKSLAAMAMEKAKSGKAAKPKQAKPAAVIEEAESPQAPQPQSFAARAMSSAKKSAEEQSTKKKPAQSVRGRTKSPEGRPSSSRDETPASDGRSASQFFSPAPVNNMPAYSPYFATPASIPTGRKQENIVAAPVGRTPETTEVKSKKRSPKVVSPKAVVPKTTMLTARSIILRLIVAGTCALVLFLVQPYLNPSMQMPTGFQTAQPMKQLLSSGPASQREDLQSFKSNLVATLKDKYSEDLSVAQLWDTYQQLKQTNNMMTAVMGGLLGFVIASMMI